MICSAALSSCHAPPMAEVHFACAIFPCGLHQACFRKCMLFTAIVAIGSQMMDDMIPELACICLLQMAHMSCLLLPLQIWRQLGLHHPDFQLSVHVQEAVEAGKVKHLGLSEVSPADIRKVHQIHPVSLVELEWSLVARDAEVRPGAVQISIMSSGTCFLAPLSSHLTCISLSCSLCLVPRVMAAPP